MNHNKNKIGGGDAILDDDPAARGLERALESECV